MNWGPPPANWSTITEAQLEQLREILGRDSDNMGDYIVYRSRQNRDLPFACNPYGKGDIRADPEAIILI